MSRRVRLAQGQQVRVAPRDESSRRVHEIFCPVRGRDQARAVRQGNFETAQDHFRLLSKNLTQLLQKLSMP